MSNWTVIKVFNTRHEAEIAKGFLETHGIKSTVSADDEGGASQFPFQPGFSGAKLLVEETDKTKAHELLGN